MSNKRPQKTRFVLCILIFICLALGFFLRLYRLEDFPVQVNQDELSNFYDAYSIVETGADRWGCPYPVILRGFGDADYRPPLYSWLSAGTIRVLGYSVFAGRLPSALLGLLSLLLVYLTARKMGSRLFACLALLSASLSPWHLTYSRFGSEGAMLTAFFVILSLYLWIRAREKKYPVVALLLLGLAIGLGTNTYQAGKLIFFLLTLLVTADLFIFSGRSYKKVLLLGVFCLVGAAPQLWAAISVPEQFMARANGTMMPASFTFYYVSNVLRNIFYNLSPAFLFFSFSDFNYDTIGRLLPVEFAFFYLGLFHLSKAFKRPYPLPPLYFYLVVIIVILPSALTAANPHALRTSGLVVLLPLLSSAGIVFTLQQIRQLRWKKVFLGATVCGMVVNALYFVSEYTNSAEMQNNRQPQDLVLLSTRLNQYKNQYARIYVEDMGKQHYIYISHYCGIKPREFQQMPKKILQTGGWDQVVQLGKYHFLSRSDIEKQTAAVAVKSLVLLYQRHPTFTLIDSIEAYKQKKIYFYESLIDVRH